MGRDNPSFIQAFPLIRKFGTGNTDVSLGNALLDRDCGPTRDANLLDIDDSWEERGKNIFNEISAIVALSSRPSATRARSIKDDSRPLN